MSVEYAYSPDGLTTDELHVEHEHLIETLDFIQSNRQGEGFDDSEGLVAASERFFAKRLERVQELLGIQAISSIQ